MTGLSQSVVHIFFYDDDFFQCVRIYIFTTTRGQRGTFATTKNVVSSVSRILASLFFWGRIGPESGIIWSGNGRVLCIYSAVHNRAERNNKKKLSSKSLSSPVLCLVPQCRRSADKYPSSYIRLMDDIIPGFFFFFPLCCLYISHPLCRFSFLFSFSTHNSHPNDCRENNVSLTSR